MTARESVLPPLAASVSPQFDDLDQQRAAARLGMWTFLATETLFFGALLLVYAVARWQHPEAFVAASRHTRLVLGTVNTAVLLTSSLSMALAVSAASMHARKATIVCLAITALLGIAFAGLKVAEYAIDWRERLFPGARFAFEPVTLKPGAELFFWYYFTSTGLHLVHLSIGIAIVGALAVRVHRSHAASLASTIEATGLYWHFVDIVWVFLYPLLYLVSRA